MSEQGSAPGAVPSTHLKELDSEVRTGRVRGGGPWIFLTSSLCQHLWLFGRHKLAESRMDLGMRMSQSLGPDTSASGSLGALPAQTPLDFEGVEIVPSRLQWTLGETIVLRHVICLQALWQACCSIRGSFPTSYVAYHHLKCKVMIAICVVVVLMVWLPT